LLLAEAAEHASDLFGFSPDAWVAIGTILLATATGVLGFLTWQLGQASRRDVEAQWRPVIVQSDRRGFDIGWHLKVWDDGDKRLGWLNITNAGSGPALQLQFYVDAPERTTEDHWGALASGDLRYFDFELPPGATRASCRFTYKSISGQTYPSKFLIEAMPGSDRWKISDILVHGDEAFA
jgi:hypothetical protein